MDRKPGTSNSRIVNSARAYHEKYGAALGLKSFDPTPSGLTVTPEQSTRIVSAYEDRKHDPNDPETKAAYEAFKRETLAQYNHAVAHGLKVMRWYKDGQPYANSQAMRDHVDADHAIYYFPTANGYEAHDASSHPPMEQAPGQSPGVLYNDLFRAVHEYYAHAMHGHEFGPKGELRAWHEHAKMYSPLARRALTNETLGQTQWFFHGPHRDKPVPERPFPEQRAAILPEDVEPTHLARNEMKVVGPGDANRQIGSANHATRLALVKTILAEAGLTSARVQAVFSHEGATGARPAVLATLAQADPRVARFAAAWIGLLTAQPRVTVFHPGTGEDVLHLIDSPHPPEHVGEYLRRAGVPSFSMEKRAGGTRAYVVNPMDLIDVETAARGLQGSTQRIPGTAVRLGAGNAKDSRAAYRTVIEDAEKEAGGGNG